MAKEYKLSIRVTPEFYERFSSTAKKYGLTLNQFGNMSIQAGMGSILRAIDPELAFSPEFIMRLVKEAEKQGVEVDLDKLTKGLKDDR